MNISIKFNDDVDQELEVKLCEDGGILIKISHPEDDCGGGSYFLECDDASRFIKHLDTLKKIVQEESPVNFIKII